MSNKTLYMLIRSIFYLYLGRISIGIYKLLDQRVMYQAFNKYSKNLKMTWKAINDTHNRHKTKTKS